MEVYVIRHTKLNIEKDVCYGRLNVSLSESFQEDAKYYKKKLPDTFDAVFSSPSERCMSLAEKLSLQQILNDNRLLEIDFGDWEGKKWNDIDKQQLDKWMNDFVNQKPENGESLIEMYERVTQFMENLKKQDHKRVLLVTHAGVIRCLWSYLLKIPLNNIFKIPVGFQEVFVFEVNANESYNRIIKTK
ncbi:alpha-ribazole phosphatase [Galbibacter mesophilus]|uniref:alpha-ribazole phosphatase n=1 Tax=Galbibacter mesophilus TaxID=379069 RepID=UPI00191D1C1B|nr:alpha-ribazole phosphatase [Galbibacter mesophilus]MCM5663745.1 alpha-ribazole phosphatase [Galbibacter mesophilus]